MTATSKLQQVHIRLDKPTTPHLHMQAATNLDAAPATAQQDAELLRLCACFQTADAKLDQVMASDGDEPDDRFMALHREWCETLRRALLLPAFSVEGQFAKTAVLIRAAFVVLGNCP
jgi:hypothetical protein